MKVGVIGLGNMGRGIALNLRKAGHDMMVHDARRAVAEPHLTAGSAWGEDVAEVARFSEVVFTSLPGPPEVESVALGENGLLANMQPGSTWFDLSTNSPKRATSATLSPQALPAWRCGSATARRASCTIMSWPALRRLRAIPLPMLPRPITPTFIRFVSLS